MQPLGTKKSRNLQGRKKITQPLGTKKNHATSWDKNHATSQDKKITQPLGTKKIMQPLGIKKNHAISQDKKVTLSIGPIASKLVHKSPNCSKWHQL